MTWTGKRVIDIRTGEKGKIISDDNMNVTRVLGISFPSGEQIVSMNNVCYTREFEIETQDKYKHLFYENKDLKSLPYEWLPFSDEEFVKDPIEFIENWATISPELKNNHVYKERFKNHKEIKN